MKIRQATNDDFTALMNIITTTSSSDALWNLLVPRAALKDAAFKDHISTLLKQYIDPNNKDWLVSVVELPEKDVTPGAGNIASFAIWDMAIVNGKSGAKDAPENDGAPAIDDTNRWLSRFVKFNAGIAEGREKNFGGFNKRMFLRVIATHHEYKDEGYAKHLLKAGYEIARRNEAAVTVLAGPQGYVFFSGLGFKDKGPMVLTGADESVNIKAMSFDPANERRRSSVMEQFMHWATT